MKSNKPPDNLLSGLENDSDEMKLPPEDFETQEKFNSIILQTQNSSIVQVPDDFTAKVMDRVSNCPQHRTLKLGDHLLQFRKTLNLKDWLEVADASECALYFLLVSFFYFILGVILLVGLKTLQTRIPLAVWVTIQPQIAFVTAFGFTALGLILLKKSKFAFKIAQMGTILYIGFAVFNGIGIQAAPGNPFNAAGMFCYTVGAILLGLFLTITLQKYQAKSLKRQVNYNH
jgi:hypothetical protein